MPLTLGSNLLSLLAQRRLGQTTSSLESVYERLATGQRINRASDDAAGLAIADSLRSDSRVYSQALRNANDGVSILAIADSGLEQLGRIVTRINELAEQAANGVYSSKQRQALDSEAQALVAEYNRITSSVKFNGINLLDGQTGRIDIQVGLDSSSTSRISINLPEIVASATWDGTFSVTDTIAQGGRSQTVATGDINGDGYIDLIGTGMSGSSLEYALGNGDGTFSNAVQIDPNNHSAIAVGDFNGDGLADIIASRGGSSVYYRSNGSTLVWSGVVGAVTRAINPPLVSDLNGDGALDLILVDETGDLYQTIMGNGNGTFQAAQNTAVGADVLDAAYGDLNNDGNVDIFFRIGSGNERVAFGNGDGTFQVAVDVGNYTLDRMELGDINNDGNLDLISATQINGGVVSYLGNGDGTFGTATTIISQTLDAQLSLFDVNQDGNLDVIRQTYNATAGMRIYFGNGNGTFATGISYNNGYSTTQEVVFDDFNNDGIFDAVIPGYDNNSMRVMTAGSIESAGLSNISLLTQDSAREALSDTSSLISQISSARASLGADRSRLEAAIGHVENLRVNTIASEARIRDADIASEAAELTRLQILQQLATAVLAQANIQPQIGLKLLETSFKR